MVPVFLHCRYLSLKWLSNMSVSPGQEAVIWSKATHAEAVECEQPMYAIMLSAHAIHSVMLPDRNRPGASW